MNNILSAYKSMLRNLSMTLASLLLITLTLIVVGFVFTLSLNSRHIAKGVVDSLTITVFVNQDVDETGLSEIKNEIESTEGVDTVTFSSKDEELKNISGLLGTDGDSIYKFFSEDNPVMDAYIVSVDSGTTDFNAITTKLKAIEGVNDAVYGGDQGADGLISSMVVIQSLSIAVALILLFVSIFIITNTIKLNITARFKEIEIMRLVGATKAYIRAPFIVEGLSIGLFGGIIAFLVIGIGYHQLLNSESFTFAKSLMLTSSSINTILGVFLPLIGMLIGAIGSVLAIRKYLRK